MRRRLIAAAAVLSAAFLLPGPASADPSPDPSASALVLSWGSVADDLIDRSVAVDDGHGSAFAYASLAYAFAHRSGTGWRDGRALAYLAKVIALRNPDGGWGLNRPYDAFADGTTNPATTTYTITVAVHVGLVLVDAYRAGAVDAALITAVTQRLYAIPRIPVPGGYCIPYSATAVDNQAGYCVHNVNAGVALYLRAVELAGLPSSQLWMTRIMLYEARTYDVNARNWRYFDASPNFNDYPHNGLNFEAMLFVGSAVGRDGLLWYQARDDPADPNDFWLHLQLAGYACPAAARWLPEVQAELAKPANSTLELMSQAARYATRAAMSCDDGQPLIQ